MTLKTSSTSLVLLLSLLLTSCIQQDGLSEQWELVGEVLEAGAEGSFDHMAVKDPSIVEFGGEVHLFYSGRASGRIACGYAHAPSIAELREAPRILLDTLAGRTIIAPQIFYFEPQELWYLIAHSPLEEGRLDRLTPVYMSNPDIRDAAGWSQAELLPTGKAAEDFGIDYWVICDEVKAYLFYSDQQGCILRMSCPLEAFPGGFAASIPEVAIRENHLDELPAWKMFEAAHIYRVVESGQYLALLEGGFPHPDGKREVDARSRFIFCMVADALDGSWTYCRRKADSFLSEARNLQGPDGLALPYTTISHPELIRAGYDQRLEIPDHELSMIIQTLDGSKIPDNYHYPSLPWRLLHIRNTLSY